MSRILAVDDEPADLNLVRRALEKQNHQVVTAASAKDALHSLRRGGVDAVALDVMLPDGDGLDVLKRIRAIDQHLPVILITSASDSSMAIQAMKFGAFDYLLKPINVADLRTVVERAAEIRRLAQVPFQTADDRRAHGLHSMIGRCPAMQEVYKSIGIVAAQGVTVLVRGESGTGKELVARALYQYGERVQGPFVAVNCAAIPETLLESELFGHEKGSFTGADRKRIGKFEQAAGGTLFLDEIGDMSPVLQSKMLRVLQEKEFERIGGNETVRVDVRVIAATHRPLERMVADGRFRADLYYRLNGFSIHLPPLRDRGTDLDALVDHFRHHACKDLNKEVRIISPEAMERMRRYHWPGNIRELQNVVRQAVLKTTGPVLLPDSLPAFVADARPGAAGAAEAQAIMQPICEAPPNPAAVAPARSEDDSAIDHLIARRISQDSSRLYDDVVGDVEQRLVRRVLELTAGDQKEAIRRLGVDPSRLRSRRALGLLGLEHSKGKRHTFLRIRRGMTMSEIEAEAIRQALRHTHGCRKQAAQLLGISTRTMQRRVKELALD